MAAAAPPLSLSTSPTPSISFPDAASPPPPNPARPSAAGPSKRLSSLPPPTDAAANPPPPIAAAAGGGEQAQVAGAASMAPSIEMEFEDGDVPVCFGCKQVLGDPGGESVVVSFANALWHCECFRCSKCQKLVQHDSNIILLSDGSPVCEKCSYICSACRRPISNEAIVTGDESYHSECFRCRTCRTHITELIFAKTSQGIYCMGCHNERVTRSRKLAEAKRGRGGAQKRDGPRLRDKPASSRPTTTATTANGEAAVPPPRLQEPTSTSTRRYAPSDGNPVVVSPPPPAPSETETPPDSASIIAQARQASLPDPRPQPQPNGVVQPAHARRTSADASTTTSPPASSTIAKSRERRANSVDVAPSVPPKDEPRAVEHSRVASTSSSDRALPGLPTITAARSGSTSSNRSRRHDARPSTADPSPPQPTTARFGAPGGERSASPLARPYESSPALNGGGAEVGAQQHRREPSKESSATNGSGGGADVKASGLTVSFGGGEAGGRANRRSGFYGFSARPGALATAEAPESGGNLSPKSGAVVSGSEEGTSSERGEAQAPQTPPPVVATGENNVLVPSLPPLENQRPMSFYDPDTLLFLDAVASPPRPRRSPPSPSTTAGVPAEAAAAATPEETETLSAPGTPDADHLSPVIETADVVPSRSTRRETVESEKAAEDLTRRVRQSILQTKRKASGEMNLDVSLVENLLAELEGTKEKMKTLQGQYNAMKRASRTAFEGFNMAREEYDREVAARHEAEAHMVALKSEMAELASRLAAADTLKSLQNQSQQLRSSVDGLQRKLSVLQVERDIKVAEVEALQKLDPKSSDAAGQVASVPRSLSTRLEVIKQGYRVQIDELANERDALAREVDHLRRVRDAQTAELEELNRRSDMLASHNENAQRELEQVRAMISRVSARPGVNGNPKGGAAVRHLAHSPSASGFGSAASSSEGTTAVDEPGGDPQVATSRRFKWGKHHAPSKSGATLKAAAAAAGQGAHRPSPSSLDLNGQAMRPHNFQPVSVLRPVRCDHCGDKLWGLAEVRCTTCGVYCHAKCAAHSLFGCSSSQQMQGVPEEGEADGPSMFGNDLVAQAKAENSLVPRIVTRCVDAVEHNGLSFEGIYRKTGAMSQVKVVQSCFDSRTPFDLTDRDRFNDISAVTSALKNYFRQLPNPLFTFEMHEAFISASAMPQEGPRIEAFERLVHQLPPVHFRTLEVLMRHLNRIHLTSDENKMTPQNLGVVFGPTLLRSQNPQRQFSDMPGTAKVVEAMVENTSAIFRRPHATIA